MPLHAVPHLKRGFWLKMTSPEKKMQVLVTTGFSGDPFNSSKDDCYSTNQTREHDYLVNHSNNNQCFFFQSTQTRTWSHRFISSDSSSDTRALAAAPLHERPL